VTGPSLFNTVHHVVAHKQNSDTNISNVGVMASHLNSLGYPLWPSWQWETQVVGRKRNSDP